MNCAECRDNLVACLEELLDSRADPPMPGASRKLRGLPKGIRPSATCKKRLDGPGPSSRRGVPGGTGHARGSTTTEQTGKDYTNEHIFKNRWGFGLGAAATAAAVILIIALAAPKAQAKAADVLAKGAQAVANLTSVHLKGQLRTLPRDNFSYIDASSDFYPIELWKQFQPELKWRVEKPGPGRGHGRPADHALLQATINEAYKIARRTTSAFDTEWLHRIANLSNTISNELRHAQAKGWKLDLAEETGADGRPKSIVTVRAKCGLPDDDYCGTGSCTTPIPAASIVSMPRASGWKPCRCTGCAAPTKCRSSTSARLTTTSRLTRASGSSTCRRT